MSTDAARRYLDETAQRELDELRAALDDRLAARDPGGAGRRARTCGRRRGGAARARGRTRRGKSAEARDRTASDVAQNGKRRSGPSPPSGRRDAIGARIRTRRGLRT